MVMSSLSSLGLGVIIYKISEFESVLKLVDQLAEN